MTETYTYDAFGTLKEIQSLNENGVLIEAEDTITRFLYAGEQYDDITGLYYLRARRYDTTAGRFIQEDTYLGDGRNLYIYVGNNPLKYVDPSGHKRCSNNTQEENSFLDNLFQSITQGAVISSQMADSYSGQVGRDWGTYISPIVEEDPLGSARDFGIGVVDTLSPIPTGLDQYVEHYELYLTGSLLAMPISGDVEDAFSSIGKVASKADDMLDTVDTVSDITKMDLDDVVDSVDTVTDMAKADLDDMASTEVFGILGEDTVARYLPDGTQVTDVTGLPGSEGIEMSRRLTTDEMTLC